MEKLSKEEIIAHMKKLILAIIVIAFTSCEWAISTITNKGVVTQIDKGNCKTRVRVMLEEGSYLYYETNDTVFVGDTIYFKKK